MKCQWTQVTPDQIEIRATPRPVLMFFGLPFLGLGLWLGWNFIGAAMDVITHKVGLFDNILGVTLLPVIAAAFIWPGLLMVFAKKRWLISGARGEAQSTTSVLFLSWGKKHPLSDFQSIRVYQGKEDSRNVGELPSEEDHRRYTVKQPYCVDFVPRTSQGRSQTVGVTADAVDAVLLGKALSALTKLPLVDDTANNGEEEVLRIDVGPSAEAI
jgi:hypothetical protein